MKTFDEILVDTALEFVNVFGETVTFITLARGSSLYQLATQGMYSGKPVTLATIGIIAAEEGLEDDIEVERVIKAVVRRGLPQEIAGVSNVHTIYIEADVVNDNVTGILSSEIDIGCNYLSMPVRIGQAAMVRKINGIIRQDKGMMSLEIR